MRALSTLLCFSLVLVPLMTLADDGAIQVTLDAPSAKHPAWSPDGSQIAFSHSSTAIAVVPATGGAATVVAGTSLYNASFYPTWSPDGAEIAFLAARWGVWALVYAVPSAGGTARLMVNCWGCNHWFGNQPCWSPDGTVIVCRFDSYSIGGEAHGIINLPVNVPGGQVVCYDESGETCGTDPCWSPDMTQIAFEWSGSGSNADIWIIPAAGGAETQLTTDGGYDGQPAWSSDGRIAFCSDRTGNEEIWVMPASGGVATRVTNHPGSDSFPAWSPDGSRIAFCSDRSGTEQIWVIGTGPVAVHEESWGSIKGKFRE